MCRTIEELSEDDGVVMNEISNEISEFKGINSFLSNFHPSTIMVDGNIYRTVEHAFQASKAVSRKDHEAVRLENTPAEAKARGRTIQIRGDWEEVKKVVMKKLVRAKFQQNKHLLDRLLATGEKELIEGNLWHDIVWGVCHCSRHGGRGENLLGKILMEVRKELNVGD